MRKSDTFEYRTAYCKNSYIVLPTLIKYNLAFDIGANLGGFSKAFEDSFNKIIAVEAFPETFQKCKQNLADLTHATCLNKAVSDVSDKEMLFFSHKNGDSGSTTSINLNSDDLNVEQAEKVKSISYEDLVKKYGTPDYMKVDIEGGEYDFLMNKDLSGIKFLSLELHSGYLSTQQKNEVMTHILKYFTIFKHKKGIPSVCHDEFALINWDLHYGLLE